MSNNVSHSLPDSAQYALNRLLISEDPNPLDSVVFGAGGVLTVQGQFRVGRLLITHGAGAGLDSKMLLAYREALAAEGVQTLGMEFAYLREMRKKGRRRPPPKVECLVSELAQMCDVLSQVSQVSQSPLWLGGKSMGGRVASLLAIHRQEVAGLVLCGYPFHPKGKPETLRLDHWGHLSCPTLVLQGTRDPFGSQVEVEGYALPSCATVRWLDDGDHDWQPRRASGLSQALLVCAAAGETAAFMRQHDGVTPVG
ncbi:alpha/beta family hydrolase [Halomonas halocynthiae]|uniref:alpha/beta family hydrolase n=1 Tax=Halomonas halocynthiae TaxID=176290 RepID=UPI00042099F0|nr:alpha/beta family hydrolase [Halomonas halocynthiae]